jgi:NAD(P)-dependent dehydrogenase (short-subunit alcohol dehydrogenase family)
MNFSLEGKNALVTGGSRGIGQAISLAFAEAGANVALASRKLKELERVAAEIVGRWGRESFAVSAHIGKMKDIYRLVETVVVRLGRIDILVNNAGRGMPLTPALAVGEDVWDSVMNVNLKGLFFLSQAVAKVMKDSGGGKIINVSSIAGFKPHESLAVYAISKAGVIMATKVMAKEWAPYNIRVNTIAPGHVQTIMTDSYFSMVPEAKQNALNATPLGRIAQADEIAGAAVYLASDASSFVTGETLLVDGGILLH